MKKIAGFLAAWVMLCAFGNGLKAQQANDFGRSVALILEVKGADKAIQSVGIYKTNVFEGKAKNIYSLGSVHSETAFRVDVINADNEKIYEAYLDNPLDLQLESFDPDGTIQRSNEVKAEGHVNLRFPLPEGSGTLTLLCYQQEAGAEGKLVSTIQMSYDEK